jgi:hypothetical protein
MQNHVEPGSLATKHESRPLAIGLTLISAFSRLVPHAPNVTPLGGSCLFAGSRISGWLAWLLPLAVMSITDPFVGGYRMSSIAIYAAFLINVWIGRTFVKNVTPVRVGAAAFACSLQFFLITNFAVWLESSVGISPLYPANVQGLAACYIAALPFWGRTLAGDLIFSGAIFGLYELLKARLVRERSATA